MFSKWGVDVFMFEKESNFIDNEGFVLLESLVSLSLITSILLVLLTSIVHVSSFREKEKAGVEMYRMLYDTATVWEKKNTQSSERYGKWSYQVKTTNTAIEINNSEHGLEANLELVSFDFN